MKRLIMILCLVSVGCAVPPPNLTPDATWAFNETRTIKGLDLVRDTVVAANKEVPPLVSTDFMVKVTKFHRSALDVIHAHAFGWQAEVTAAEKALLANAPPKEAALAKPYLVLLNTILNEVH